MTAATADKLIDQLQSLRGGATYYCGTLGTDQLRIWVRGLGPLSFPLDRSRIDTLLKLPAAAPSEQRQPTLLSTTLPASREIDATRMRLSNRNLKERLDAFLAKAAGAMNVSGGLRALPHKLLIDSTGGDSQHRPPEKLPGTAGTLLIGLPSAHGGGTLRIDAGEGEPIVVDFSQDEAADFPVVALLADCKYSILPLTGSHHAALVYHLVYADEQPSDHVDIDAVAQDLALTLGELGPDDEPIVIALDHQYTAFSPAQLRGNDRVRVAALQRAALLAGIEIRIGLVEEMDSVESLDDDAFALGSAAVTLWHPAATPRLRERQSSKNSTEQTPEPQTVEAEGLTPAPIAQPHPNPQTDFVRQLAQTALAEGYKRKDVQRALGLYRDYFADLVAGRPPREQRLSAAVDALLDTWEGELDRRYEAGTDAAHVPTTYPSLDHMSRDAFGTVVDII